MKTQFNETWENFIETASKKDGIILFGASSCADIFLNKIKEKFQVKYILDNDSKKWGQKLYEKYDIFSVEKLSETCESDVILITSTYYAEISKQLDKLGFKGSVYSFLHLQKKVVTDAEHVILQEKLPVLKEICADERSKEILASIAYKRIHGINDWSDICEENQYFIADIMKVDEEEVFVDGGAYNGETVREFIKFTNDKYKKIYSFEMDSTNFKRIKQEDFDERVVFYNYGLWDTYRKLSFIENERGSEVAENGSAVAECIDMDSLIKEKVTFIKMDIEGAELKALEGAKNIIMKDKPKLAICLYHKLEDLWEIPMYVRELVPEYKIFIRHHGKNDEETVMYAYV